MINLTKYANFLEEHKKYVGFADWKITVKEDFVSEDDIAEIIVDELEKELLIKLSKSFFEAPQQRKFNTLFHELVHGRVRWFKDRVETFEDREEELMVNDLTRGFEMMAKWNRRKK